jgi:hypothetical protein
VQNCAARCSAGRDPAVMRGRQDRACRRCPSLQKVTLERPAPWRVIKPCRLSPGGGSNPDGGPSVPSPALGPFWFGSGRRAGHLKRSDRSARMSPDGGPILAPLSNGTVPGRESPAPGPFFCGSRFTHPASAPALLNVSPCDRRSWYDVLHAHAIEFD